MGIIGHTLTSIAAFGVSLIATKSLAFAVGAGSASLFWDIDHWLDYRFLDHQRSLNPLRFVRHYLGPGNFPPRRLLLLHSYEVIFLLGLVALLTGSPTPAGCSLGGLIHVCFDIAPDGTSQLWSGIKRYSLAYRWCCGFQSSRIY